MNLTPVLVLAAHMVSGPTFGGHVWVTGADQIDQAVRAAAPNAVLSDGGSQPGYTGHESIRPYLLSTENTAWDGYTGATVLGAAYSPGEYTGEARCVKELNVL